MSYIVALLFGVTIPHYQVNEVERLIASTDNEKLYYILTARLIRMLWRRDYADKSFIFGGEFRVVVDNLQLLAENI